MLEHLSEELCKAQGISVPQFPQPPTAGSAPGAGLVLFFRMGPLESSLPRQDTAKASQCPAGTPFGGTQSPQPLLLGEEILCPLTPAAEMLPKAFPPLPSAKVSPQEGSLKPFPGEKLPERRLPGQERSRPDHRNTEGSAGDQTPWLAAFKGGRGSAKSRGCLSQHAASSSPPSF